MYCVLGKEKYDPANVTCRSCQKQGVACPFPCAVEKTPVRDEISKQDKNSPKGKEPNKTEKECGHILSFEYPGASVRYEAITLVLASGHRYTADWVVVLTTGEVVLVEAKNGAYRHASYGRSKLAFDSAKVEYPCFQFQWREKFKDGWRVEV